MQLRAMRGGKGHVGEHISFGLVHKRSEFRHSGTQLVGDLAPLRLGGAGVVLGKGGADEGGDDTSSLLSGMRQHVAHEVHAAALPARAEHFGDGDLDTLMRVRDHQLDAAQPTPRQLAEEVRPKSLGLRCADRQAQHLAPTGTVDANRDDHRYRDDAAVVTHLQVGRIQPHIRPVALERPVEEGLDLVIDLAAEPRHLALGDTAHPHRLDEIVDRARRHTLDIGLLDHRRQRLLRHTPRLQEPWEVAALPELRNAQLHRARARLPQPIAKAVAVIEPIGMALAMRRPVKPSTSNAISRCAAKPIISRRSSASELFSSSA
jgi:hypothetical protein